ncbi:hypothetical protein MMC13_003251 [Lambiella insularis]|nr:hypothetical protein [Lambiella insularis]
MMWQAEITLHGGDEGILSSVDSRNLVIVINSAGYGHKVAGGKPENHAFTRELAGPHLDGPQIGDTNDIFSSEEELFTEPFFLPNTNSPLQSFQTPLENPNLLAGDFSISSPFLPNINSPLQSFQTPLENPNLLAGDFSNSSPFLPNINSPLQSFQTPLENPNLLAGDFSINSSTMQDAIFGLKPWYKDINLPQDEPYKRTERSNLFYPPESIGPFECHQNTCIDPGFLSRVSQNTGEYFSDDNIRATSHTWEDVHDHIGPNSVHASGDFLADGQPQHKKSNSFQMEKRRSARKMGKTATKSAGDLGVFINFTPRDRREINSGVSPSGGPIRKKKTTRRRFGSEAVAKHSASLVMSGLS